MKSSSETYYWRIQVREEHSVLMDAQYDWEEEETTAPEQLENGQVTE